MAKNDYYVIVYQILAYLYQQLKNGKDIDPRMIECDSPLFANINKKYWAYIIYNMSRYEFIEGVDFVEIDGMNVPLAVNMKDCTITPTGIEYLCDNALIEKAKQFLKDIKEITPFI